jgi:hypothetical protein
VNDIFGKSVACDQSDDVCLGERLGLCGGSSGESDESEKDDYRFVQRSHEHSKTELISQNPEEGTKNCMLFRRRNKPKYRELLV